MWILITLSIFLFLFILLLSPIGVDFKLYFNPLKNKNIVMVKLLFFKILFLAEIENGKINITDKKGEKKEVSFSALSKFQKVFFKGILKKIDVEKVFIVFKGGVKDDAYKTSMLCGGALSFLNILKIYLKNKNNVTINFNIDTNYKQDILTIGANFLFEISLFAVITSFIKALFSSKGENDGKRAKSNSKHSSKHAI